MQYVVLLTFAVCMKYDTIEALSSKFLSLTISLVTHVVIYNKLSLYFMIISNFLTVFERQINLVVQSTSSLVSISSSACSGHNMFAVSGCSCIKRL